MNSCRFGGIKILKERDMALLKLKDIGKIYVSEGNIAVGIRGINLSFDKGEFVAITGKSGSGKSTLLNIISGMDSYEEGELYVENNPTSHYIQSDWEEYRKEYISFIFQDYNIIDSFTVLQNVELALMNIKNKKERRARALELIDRVGLTDRIHHKGSQLSGGQKQRTVIARALAKDSPIILADEPTGNLDSKTSVEIIKLLKEVAENKLLIVVTHNFEQVEDYATREIRIYDGAIEFDHKLRADNKESVTENKQEIKEAEKNKKNKEFVNDFKDGLKLGGAIYTSKPKLTVFISLLLLMGTLGLFFVTSSFNVSYSSFGDPTMFTPMDGRVIVTKDDGSLITDEELGLLASEYGVKDYIRYDLPLDYGSAFLVLDDIYTNATLCYNKDFGSDIIGRYPERDNEIFLYAPISLRNYFGKAGIINNKFELFSYEYDVVGVKYFYDNNLPFQILLTKDAYFSANYMKYITEYFNYADVLVESTTGYENISHRVSFYQVVVSPALQGDSIYLSSSELSKYDLSNPDIKITGEISSNYYAASKNYTFSYTFDNSNIVDSEILAQSAEDNFIYISVDVANKMVENAFKDNYVQFSLFFENDKAAAEAAEKLSNSGYIAVLSTDTYEQVSFELILLKIFNIITLCVWFGAVIFIAFFINLCCHRAMDAFKADMAIMRSMGISAKVIRIGMYSRMFISIIPAFVLFPVIAITIFTVPSLNALFKYLYWWHYLLIVLGMLIMTARVAHKQIDRLFKESVKKSLRGGDAK